MDIIGLFSSTDWLYAILVFFARLTDVSLGTLRTIAIVHGRTMLAFWLGFFESAIWLAVVSTIVQAVYQQPLLGIVYAFGFASGNLAGIKIEKLIAMGHLILRIISRTNSGNMASVIRAKGYRVTTFAGQCHPLARDYVDGPAEQVCLHRPASVHLDPQGKLLVAAVASQELVCTQRTDRVCPRAARIFQSWRSSRCMVS